MWAIKLLKLKKASVPQSEEISGKLKKNRQNISTIHIQDTDWNNDVYGSRIQH